MELRFIACQKTTTDLLLARCVCFSPVCLWCGQGGLTSGAKLGMVLRFFIFERHFCVRVGLSSRLFYKLRMLTLSLLKVALQ